MKQRLGPELVRLLKAECLIEEGIDDWVKVLTDFYGPFNKTINSLKGKEQKIKESMVKETDQKCEKCDKPMVIKWGRNGQFLACSGWPDCMSSLPRNHR